MKGEIVESWDTTNDKRLMVGSSGRRLRLTSKLCTFKETWVQIPAPYSSLQDDKHTVKVASLIPSTEWILHCGSFIPLGHWPQDLSCSGRRREASLLPARFRVWMSSEWE